MFELKAPLNNATVSLQTVEQKIFIEEEPQRAAMEVSPDFCWYDPNRPGCDLQQSLPVSFSWEETAEERDLYEKVHENADDNAYYFLLISETEDMRNAWVYMTRETCYDVYNLKVGMRYFWCVQRNGRRSEVSSFQTLLTLPRCIKLDGTTNVRDIGGYKTEEGRIPQGLVYRGAEHEVHLQLQPAGLEDLRRLAIRTEIDLRGEAKGRVEFTVGEIIGIDRVYVPSAAYADVFQSDQHSSLNSFYKVFSDPNNYPIYFHCWGGADRTGTLAFILGAFLGMSLKDLLYEYEFTSISICGIRSRNRKEFKQFFELFMGLPGDTLREKSRFFLSEYAGMTEKQLDAIYKIMVEKE